MQIDKLTTVRTLLAGSAGLFALAYLAFIDQLEIFFAGAFARHFSCSETGRQGVHAFVALGYRLEQNRCVSSLACTP